VRGYYSQLASFLDHAVAERFVTAEHREMLVVEQRADAMIEAFRRWRPPVRTKWIDRSES
jgi:predicted Rossmann-fold nucleotide-binding protein